MATHIPCKRNDDSDDDFNTKKLKVVPLPCGSQNQTQTPPSIYCGPGAGIGYTYFFLQMSEEEGFSQKYFEHTIIFKGDFFTVREDITMPPEDKTIRSVLDPANNDFLEVGTDYILKLRCLKNELCPTEFLKARDGSEISKERDGLHIIRLVGLHDDQDLEDPPFPGTFTVR